MRFVKVTHPTQGTATVPETAVVHMAAQGWTPVDPALVPVAPKPFDPSEHTIEEVEHYVAYASPEESERVIDAERAGLNRPEIVGE